MSSPSAATAVCESPPPLRAASARWPERAGRYVLAALRELNEREAVAEAPGAVVYLLALGRTERADEAARRIARRVKELLRVLGSAGHPALLRPLDFGIEGRFVWMAAEAPGAEAPAWSPAYPTFDSLASGLAFLHDRRYAHGRVGPDALFLRADQTVALAPWPPPPSGEGLSTRHSASIERFAFNPAPDVLAACGLLPGDDPEYAQVAELCREQLGRLDLLEHLGPPTGRILLARLRASGHGVRFAESHGLEPGDQAEELARLAAVWLECPEFVDPSGFARRERRARRLSSAWDSFLEALRAQPAVFLQGEEGFGKTRWLLEAAQRLRQQGVVVAFGRGGAAAGPILDALEDLAGQGHDLALPIARAAAASTARDLADAALEARRLLAERGPLVWLFDDADRADSRSAEAMGCLRDRAALDGFNVGSSQRRRPAARGAVTVVLPALSRRAVVALVGSLLRRAEGAERLGERLAALTGGNPLHAVEALRELVRRRSIAPRGSSWRIPAEVELPVSAGLAGLFAARLGEIDGDLPVALARLLALAGGESDAELLTQALDADIDDVLGAVEELEDKALIEAGRTSPYPLRLRAGMLTRYLADELPEAERRRLHGRLLGALERSGGPLELPGPMEPWTGELATLRRHEAAALLRARHAVAADDPEAQARYLPVAAAAAHRLGNLAEAEELYGRAIGVLPGAEEAARWCRLGMSDVLRLMGRWGEAEQGFGELIEECEGRARVHALLGLGFARREAGHLDSALRSYNEALALATSVNDAYLEGRSREALARVLADLGDFSSARSEGTSALEIYRRIGERQRVLRLGNVLDYVLLSEGGYADARQHFRDRYREVRESGDKAQMAWIGLAEGQIALESGWYVKATRIYDRVARHASLCRDHWTTLGALLAAAHALMCRLEFREADLRLDRAREVFAAAKRNDFFVALHHCRKAWRAFLDDSPAGDRQAIHLAEMAMTCESSLVRSFALATRGLVSAAREQHGKAIDLLGKASAEAERAGSRFCKHLFAIHRAVSELAAGGPQLILPQATIDDLQSAYDFSRARGCRELTFKASAVLQEIGLKDEETVAAAAEQLAAASCVSSSRLLHRRDLDLIVRHRPRLT